MRAIPNPTGFAEIQGTFAAAILSDAAPIPAAIREASSEIAASRFGVYRNNVIAGLMNAVAARYPVVRKLLWEDSFRTVARQYVTTEPPKSPVLIEYGESFPKFLRNIGQGTAVDYLADIAELEAARARAYHAADARPVGRDAFAALAPDRLADLRVKLHPSVTLLKSRFPIVSIWEANHCDGDTTIKEWKQESALVARPGLQVEVWRLTNAEHAFFAALSDGQTVAAAVERATARTNHFDLAAALTTLVAANVVVGFEPPDAPARP